MGDTDFLAFSDNDLRKMIYLKISSIISKDDFESFVNLTGNFKIYNELGALINVIPKENNKAEIDRCYEDYIFSILTDRIHKEQSNTSDKLAHDRQIREHNKLEDEIRISKLKKRIIITTSLVIGVIACVFVTVGIIIPIIKYNQAEDLYNQGKYNQALDVYESLGTYKYSQLRIQDIKHKQDYIKSITTGMSFYYGKYEQDGNQGNGNEDIEWIVLDRKDDNLLVLSVYGLDYMPYNDKWGDISWANCSLRNWLNEKFINEAFTDEESAQIIEVDLDNSDYGKAATKDKLFVLSKSEWIKYNQAYYKLQFKSNYVDQCIKNKKYEKPVVYAWWLRSPGLMDNYAMSIEEAGGGCDVNETNYANIVRPAMWIKVE